MLDQVNATPTPHKRLPWNKGKLTGAKPPLRPKHVWSIRTKLQIEGCARELAMFNLAIDSKLRGCDVVAMKVEDVAPSGYPLARATMAGHGRSGCACRVRSALYRDVSSARTNACENLARLQPCRHSGGA